MEKLDKSLSFALIGCGAMSLGLIHYMTELGFRRVLLYDLEESKVISLSSKIKKLYPKLKIIKCVKNNDINVTLLSCSGPSSEKFLMDSNNYKFLGERRLVVSLGRPNYDDVEKHKKFHDFLVENHISLLFGFGIEPGLTEALASCMARSLSAEQAQEMSIYCGGVPQKAQPPLYYNLLFGKHLPYLNRNGLWKLNDQIVHLSRFSKKESIFIDKIGFFEAYHDGLSPYFLEEKHIKNIRNIKQQTLRWPGFFDTINTLSSLGLLSDEPILEGGLTPVNFTHEVLEKKGILKQDLHDITLIYIIMNSRNGVAHKFRLCAYYDQNTNLSGMSQLTCFTAAFSAKFLLEDEDTNITYGIHLSHSWFTKERLEIFKKILLNIHPHSIIMDSYDYI